jgi:polar amino acid transport system permease protein
MTTTPLLAQIAPPSEPPMKVVPLRRPGRYVAGAVIVLLAAVGVHILVTNPNFQWGVVGDYLFAPEILEGLYVTLWLTGATMVLACVLGVLIAVMRLSPNRLASGVAWCYIWFFRGTPLLVQLVFWYNLSALFPELRFGVPFGGPTFFTADANSLITPWARSSAPASCQSTRDSGRPRPRSACRSSRPSVGSCCRRRCG